jgi:hypothetical protein
MAGQKRETFDLVTLGHIPLSRLPRPARLLHLETLPPQRDPQRRLAARRDARALSVRADGLHAVRDDRCARAAGLVAACEQEACKRASWRVASGFHRFVRVLLDGKLTRRDHQRSPE